MKKTREELESIKRFVDGTYATFGNTLITNKGIYCPKTPDLAFCYKFSTLINGTLATTYKIRQNEIGNEMTDLRILLHEYGHIYFGHLDGIHEELDTKICNIFRDFRGELIERINTECGIDFGEKLIERVIDDPVLNHSLHNIAMDMEVNSKVLSTEDIEEMEKDITDVIIEKFPQGKIVRDIEKAAAEAKTDDETSEEDVAKQKEALSGLAGKIRNEMATKLILPCRYKDANGNPFADGLRYPEYLIMIIKHLDQFVKMLVSIKKGGNGDTSDVSQQDIQDALSGGQQGQGEGQGEGGDQGEGQGSGDGMQGLSDLLREMGMSGDQNDTGLQEDTGKESAGMSGRRDNNGTDEGGLKEGSHGDHRSDSRDEADQKREVGQIRSGGGVGCGNSGGPDTRRQTTEADMIDMALEDVIKNFKSKVVSYDHTRDLTYQYNRGINRSVISPTIRRKVTITTDPTIVFLIDVSGSMDTLLVDRILTTISRKMKSLSRGLKYNIISWSTRLGEHIKDIDPRKGVPHISCGGGTRMSGGMEYFKKNYSEDAILILISDFEDYLEEWHEVEKGMPGYVMYGFNYGYAPNTQQFTNFKVKECVSR